MVKTTAERWAGQDRHRGDRHRLFRAVRDAVDGTTVLYPGSYVDVAASFVWPSVTYVDIDRRAERFFGDIDGVRRIVAAQPDAQADPEMVFLAADYTSDLPLRPESFDLLVSLYAGLVSKHCTKYLRIGGSLLVNPSHGDAAMASIDGRYELHGVVHSRSGAYSISSDNLTGYLVPKKQVEITAESIEGSGRGVAYTRSAFAYLFRRVE